MLLGNTKGKESELGWHSATCLTKPLMSFWLYDPPRQFGYLGSTPTCCFFSALGLKYYSGELCDLLHEGSMCMPHHFLNSWPHPVAFQLSCSQVAEDVPSFILKQPGHRYHWKPARETSANARLHSFHLPRKRDNSCTSIGCERQQWSMSDMKQWCNGCRVLSSSNAYLIREEGTAKCRSAQAEAAANPYSSTSFRATIVLLLESQALYSFLGTTSWIFW